MCHVSGDFVLHVLEWLHSFDTVAQYVQLAQPVGTAEQQIQKVLGLMQ